MIAVRGRVTPRVIMVPALLLSLAGPALATPPDAPRPEIPPGRHAEALGPPAAVVARSLVRKNPASSRWGEVASGQFLKASAEDKQAGPFGATWGRFSTVLGELVGRGAREARRNLEAVEAVERVRAIDVEKLTRRLDGYLATRPGPVTAMVEDLATGRSFGYHHRQSMITASTAKVQILMALLMRTPWKKLPKADRRDAESMIRYSDNHAADRLWSRIGGAPGFTEAGRRLGLRHTSGVPGTCVDLYCWGITRTTAQDQVRLMKALVSERGPLAAADRAQVRRLMGEVVDGQDWGVSAARCEGDRVALKNGWLKRVSTERWAVVTAGLIRAEGRDYAVAVLSEGSAEAAHGIATVEGVAERIMEAFRRCPE